jgi:glycosyltransferase involved in cell wall biosynthesis
MATRCVILSFEGHDNWSFVGGLHSRVTQLAAALDARGVLVDHIFIGDPQLPEHEVRGGVTLHRWCQRLSAAHGVGVYTRENEKVVDFTNTVPQFVMQHIVRPAVLKSKKERVLVLAEDWQTVDAVMSLALIAQLEHIGPDQLRIVWNANSVFGFERINFAKLAACAQITCVSRFMKFELSLRGASAFVIPNGIPESIFAHPDQAHVERIRRACSGRLALLKVGRFDADKRWLQAIEACAALRDAGKPVLLLMRGGREKDYEQVILERARSLFLRVDDVFLEKPTAEALATQIEKMASVAHVLHIRSFLPDPLLFAMYAAVDAVLANSGREPFGLVGLEVMACGGVAVVGSTGEDYAVTLHNALCIDTHNPQELASQIERLSSDKTLCSRLIANGKTTARALTWSNAIDIIELKVGLSLP